jgi:hypothetical protein
MGQGLRRDWRPVYRAAYRKLGRRCSSFVHPHIRTERSTLAAGFALARCSLIASAGDEAHYSGASHEVATRARSPVRSHPLMVLKMASLSIG